MIPLVLRYWKVGLVGLACVTLVAWCSRRDERLRQEGEARQLREQLTTLAAEHAALADSLNATRETVKAAVDTVQIVTSRVLSDTVIVERLASEIRESVPDSIVAKVDSLENRYQLAVSALSQARVTIEDMARENRMLWDIKANLEAQLTVALSAQEPRGGGWLDTAVKIGGGVLAGYALAQVH